VGEFWLSQQVESFLLNRLKDDVFYRHRFPGQDIGLFLSREKSDRFVTLSANRFQVDAALKQDDGSMGRRTDGYLLVVHVTYGDTKRR
jgi:hypothetical protein